MNMPWWIWLFFISWCAAAIWTFAKLMTTKLVPDKILEEASSTLTRRIIGWVMAFVITLAFWPLLVWPFLVRRR